METRQLELTSRQLEAWRILHDTETIELLYGGAAGGGKSRLLCAWLIEQCGRYPGTRWLLGRSELKALKRTTLVTFFEVCRSLGLKANKDYIYNDNTGTITWVQGGSEILLYDLGWLPSDPNYDRLGSLELTGGAVDEVGQITFRCWETVRSRIRFRLNEYNLTPKLFGSCNPVKAWPYSEFYRPWRDDKLLPHRKFVRALPTDNHFLPPSYIESLKSMKDKAQKERLLFGNWEYDDDPSALFSIDVIADMFTNPVEADSDDRYIIGDVSRQGRDRMVLGYWEGMVCKRVIEIPFEIRKDTTKSGDFILNLATEHNVRKNRILLDEDGVGGGVVDYCGCKGFVNNSSAIFTKDQKEQAERTGRLINYANLKTQCWYLLAEKAAQAGLRIDCDPGTQELITEELEQIKRRDADKDGKVAVVGKDHIKEAIGRSPDFADMVMMRMRFELPFITEETKSQVMPFLFGTVAR